MSDVLIAILTLALVALAVVYWRQHARVAALQRDLDSVQRRAGEPQMAVEEHKRTVNALQSTINDQKHALDALHTAVAARDEAAAALQNEHGAQRERIESLQASFADLEAELAKRDADLAGLREAFSGAQGQVAALREELTGALARAASASETVAQTEADYAHQLALALTLSNAAYDSLFVVDDEHRIVAINTSAETLFGRPHPIGERLVDVTGSPEIATIVDDALAYKEESFEEQLRLDKRAYRVRAQVITRAGNTFVGLGLQDVTELVRLNRARRDMVANISHELRTPIANIRLIIDSIFHEQEKPKGKASRSALKAIAQETDTLLWLVQELLDLSMIESGQAILRMVDVPANLLVSEAIERMADQSAAKSIAIVGDVPDGLLVLCDRDQARRVFINLIHNAIKWSPPNDTIRVEVTNGDEEVTFAVLDNGPGVPEDHRERIFERFYQVDPSRSGGEGTGLGLAICKHIVEAHGGRIWVESSAQGGGGRFLFTLPNTTESVPSSDASEFA